MPIRFRVGIAAAIVAVISVVTAITSAAATTD